MAYDLNLNPWIKKILITVMLFSPVIGQTAGFSEDEKIRLFEGFEKAHKFSVKCFVTSEISYCDLADEILSKLQTNQKPETEEDFRFMIIQALFDGHREALREATNEVDSDWPDHLSLYR